MKLNFPIKLDEVFRRYIVENFREIKYYYESTKQRFIDHQTIDEHAHSAKQIDYISDFQEQLMKL